ncbi:type IV pilin protein [Aeromonas dhakensis]
MHVKGFTMIELLIVVSLSALLTAVVAPNLWGQFIRYTERNHIERYLADIKKLCWKIGGMDVSLSFLQIKKRRRKYQESIR